MRKIEVFGTHNDGYIIKYQEVVDEDETEDIYLAFNGDDEKESMIKLLTAIAEHFGFVYDKFSPNNLNITFDRKGHKVE